MPSAQASARSVVPELMNTVKQLSMAELNEFKRGFADWQAENRSQDEELGGLLEACRLSLPTPDENRL